MNYDLLRHKMVTEQLARRGIHDPRVLAAMDRVPREAFVPLPLRAHAYEDRALPIGFEQTISQPYTVAFMCQAARLAATDKVLEIGTGSGYGAAVLAELAREVHAVERIAELYETAMAAAARQLDTTVCKLHLDDGSLGPARGSAVRRDPVHGGCGTAASGVSRAAGRRRPAGDPDRSAEPSTDVPLHAARATSGTATSWAALGLCRWWLTRHASQLRQLATRCSFVFASLVKTHFLLQNSIDLQLEFCDPHWKTRANRGAAGAILSEYCDSPMDIAFELSHAASRLPPARTASARRRGTTST